MLAAENGCLHACEQNITLLYDFQRKKKIREQNMAFVNLLRVRKGRESKNCLNMASELIQMCPYKGSEKIFSPSHMAVMGNFFKEWIN